MLELLNEGLLNLLEFENLSLQSTDESFAYVDAIEVHRGGVGGVDGRHLILMLYSCCSLYSNYWIKNISILWMNIFFI